MGREGSGASRGAGGGAAAEGGAGRVTDLGGGIAIKAGGWFLSVAVLDFVVGTPVTEIYVGISIVAVGWWVAWKASGFFDEPPAHGTVELVGPDEARYRGTVSEAGEIELEGPDGRAWTGSAWSGRWTVDDPDGRAWWGRVGRKGDVAMHDEQGNELMGTLRAEGPAHP